jgi:NAD(P)-dependent dehydrogenase (short-subunit alcohol dehydrogenase family)
MGRWTAEAIPSQVGRLAIVTGPTGLGYETGLALARAGAEVILAGRNGHTGRVAATEASEASKGNVRWEELDLASLASVRTFAARMAEADRPIDLLVNNAGVMMPPMRQVTADGFELQFGTNYLGHFALTGLVLPLLIRAAAPRVVSVSSIAANAPASIHFDDLQFARSYRPTPAYGQSKVAMILFARELQRRSDAAGWRLKSVAAHPGVSRTDLIRKGPGARSAMGIVTSLIDPLLRQPVWKGALPTLFAATDPAAKPGGYYGPDGLAEIRGWPHESKPPQAATDPVTAQRLWEVSVELTGVGFEAPAAAA